MGHWVYLETPEGESCLVESHQEGGTIIVGGSTAAEISVTYNYSQYYYETIDNENGLKWIHGKKAGYTIQRLQDALDKLGDKTDSNYWARTPGNAGHILAVLLGWAYQHPLAIWRIS